MRKLILATVGAAALAVSSMASAAVTVTASTGLNNPDPTAASSIQTVAGVTTINFGQNPLATPDFSGSFTIHNTVAGVYSAIMGTSDGNSMFTAASLGGNAFVPFPDNTNLKLFPVSLGVGDYVLNFTGHNTIAGGSFTGNVTISAVPEASTWALMIVGFAGMGLAVRRRRRPALAQIA